MKNETYASVWARVFMQEDLNFLVTNRLPRRWATQFMGWFTRIKSRRLTRLSLGVWKYFADDLRLEEAVRTDFESLHECFTRELKPGTRPVCPDTSVLVSPCDAEVGAVGRIEGTRVYQSKGFPYSLDDLLCDASLARSLEGGTFVTLRLKANMYHRFHAPCDGMVTGVSYISGDTWNVNPIALERVERLFCKNERAVLDIAPQWPGSKIVMVPVAAILVASIRFNFLEVPLDLHHRGLRHFVCATHFLRGEEMGRFESGSTILLFVKGPFSLWENVAPGKTIRMGEPLLRHQPS